MDWSPIGPPIDVRPLVALDRAQLLDLLAGLPEADWGRDTACPGWTVHDVTAHVVHDHLRRLSGARDGYRSPQGFRPGEDLPRFLDRVNEEFVVAARGLSPRVLVDLLAHLGPQLDAAWAALDLDAPADLDVWWVRPGVPAPAWLDVAREFTEFWVHQQQLRDALGRPGARQPELLAAVVDTFVRGLPRALEAAQGGRAVSMAVDLGGREQVWTATRGAAGWCLDPGRHESVDATVRLDVDTFWRLATRGIEPEHARQRAQVAGDRGLADAALDLLSIVR